VPNLSSEWPVCLVYERHTAKFFKTRVIRTPCVWLKSTNFIRSTPLNYSHRLTFKPGGESIATSVRLFIEDPYKSRNTVE
jgi:hypothetical protein